jgi:hypothetical protein
MVKLFFVFFFMILLQVSFHQGTALGLFLNFCPIAIFAILSNLNPKIIPQDYSPEKTFRLLESAMIMLKIFKQLSI